MRRRPPRSPSSPRAGGFTIIEILVTMSILGTILVMVYGVFARTAQGKDLAETRAAEAQAARAILNRLRLDLQASIESLPGAAIPRKTEADPPKSSPLGPKKANLPPLLFIYTREDDANQRRSELRFTGTIRRPVSAAAGAEDATALRYFLGRDPDEGPGWSLYREAVSSLSGREMDPERPSPIDTLELAKGVEDLVYRFYDGEEWVEEWDSVANPATGILPKAVEISLYMIDPESDEANAFHTGVGIPLASPQKALAVPVGRR